MWDLHLRNREAGAFDDAVAGRASTPAAADLAAFMASVAAAVRPASPFVSERGWHRLHEALDEPREQSRVVRGALAPARSTAILGAAMAGGGLLVAGAASGVDPALVVRQVIVDTTAGRWAAGNDAPAASASELTVEGTVTSVGRDRIAVDTGTAVVDVRTDAQTRVETADGRKVTSTSVGVGDRVQVRARLLADGGLLATNVAFAPGRVPLAPVSTPGAAMVQRVPETPQAAATSAARDPGTVASPTSDAPVRPATDEKPVRTPVAGASPASQNRSDGTAPAVTKEADPSRTAAAAPSATKTVDATRTPDAAAATSRTPEPATTAIPTKTPGASISPAPVETEKPQPGDPTAAPAPVDPVPTTATPLPTPKQTPAPTKDPDRIIKEEAPVTDGDGVIIR
ncbi:MAG: DUF5666 domain-containing protein [Dehalococcoidia bacterium]